KKLGLGASNPAWLGYLRCPTTLFRRKKYRSHQHETVLDCYETLANQTPRAFLGGRRARKYIRREISPCRVKTCATLQNSERPRNPRMTSALVGHHWKDNWRYWKHLPKYRQQMVRESRLPIGPPPCPKYRRLACRRPRITAQFDSADSFAPSLQLRTPRPPC